MSDSAIQDFLAPAGTAPLVAGNTEFALDLYVRLRGQEGNLFFSPYSISTALAMTYAGARDNTAGQMAQVLHFPEELEPEHLHPAFAGLQEQLDAVQSRSGVALHVANAIWPLEGYRFLQAFLDLLKRHYGVEITPMDFARDPAGSRRTINAWVEAKTEEKIKDLLKPPHIGSDTTLVLTNAIYFKGDWASQFDQERTEDGPFWLGADRSVTVPLMAQEARFGYAETLTLQILELPYQGDALSMLVLLPKAADGLEALEASLTPATLAQWIRGLRETKVEVVLPRFKLSAEFVLNDMLAAMGMTDAFGPADFSGMTGRRDLFISVVVHKAFVDVNEEGTEAAAATAVVMGRSLPPALPVFRADHPFLFLIRDRASESVLFLGRVADPRPAG